LDFSLLNSFISHIFHFLTELVNRTFASNYNYLERIIKQARKRKSPSPSRYQHHNVDNIDISIEDITIKLS